MLVFGNENRRGLAPRGRRFHGQNLVVKKTFLPGRGVFLLRAMGELVAVLAADAMLGGDVVRGLRHRVIAVIPQQSPIREAPADGAIVQRLRAPPGGLGFTQHPRRAAHAFHAAADEQLAFPALDRPRGVQRRRRAAAAETVHGDAAHRDIQAAEQDGVAGDVAAVLAGLNAATGNDILDAGAVQIVALHERLENGGEQIVRAQRRQRPGVTAEGCADAVVDYGLRHAGASLAVVVAGVAGARFAPPRRYAAAAAWAVKPSAAASVAAVAASPAAAWASQWMMDARF